MPIRSLEPVRLAVGFRQSTSAPRPTGATSRFVGLQTPPSTYSRPSISTGANSHGTVHDAVTASATLAARRPGTAEHDPPSAAAVDRGHPQASVEARARFGDVLVQPIERLPGAGQASQERPTHQRATRRRQAQCQRRERPGRGDRPRACPCARPRLRHGEAVRRLLRCFGCLRLSGAAGQRLRSSRRACRRRGARRRSSRPRCRRSTRSGADRARSRPRSRRGRPSSTPRRARHRRRERARRGARASVEANGAGASR